VKPQLPPDSITVTMWLLIWPYGRSRRLERQSHMHFPSLTQTLYDGHVSLASRGPLPAGAPL